MENLDTEDHLDLEDQHPGLEAVQTDSVDWKHLDLGLTLANTPIHSPYTMSSPVKEFSVHTGVLSLNKEKIFLALKDNGIVKDRRGAVVLKTFRNFFTKEETKQLLETTEQLVVATPARDIKCDIKRNVHQVFHLGVWRDSAKNPFVTKATRSKAAGEWLLSNRNLLTRLNVLFKQQFPLLFEDYFGISLPVYMVGAWATVAINCNLDRTGISLHHDKHDYLEGLCWTIPFGDFQGGNLHFPRLKLEVEYQDGDVCAFQSLQEHEVLPFTGRCRYSLVLFSHNSLFFANKKK